LWAGSAQADVIWSENFDDGSISDWLIENPYRPGDQPVTIEVSEDYKVSGPKSLKITGPSANGFSGRALGPLLAMDWEASWHLRFWFRYANFHWYNLVVLGPVNLAIDQPGIALRYNNGGPWFGHLGPSVESYLPSGTWVRFDVYVDPVDHNYDVYVDDQHIGQVQYDQYRDYDTGLRQFMTKETSGGDVDYLQYGYFDDIVVETWFPPPPPPPPPPPLNPALCSIEPWDTISKAVFSPGNQSGIDSVHISIRRQGGGAAVGALVQIQTSLSFCLDEPDAGLSGVTDSLGMLALDPRAGGCGEDSIFVVVEGVKIRAYSGAAGTDVTSYCGVPDGQVTEWDQQYFLNAMNTTNYCADLNGDGVADDADYQIFEEAFLAEDHNETLCLGLTDGTVDPSDWTGQVFVSPGTLGSQDWLTVTIRDSSGVPQPGQLIEIDLSDCHLLCIDQPDAGLSAYTDANGVAYLQPSVGGCEECAVRVRANGVIIREYPFINSTDWDGTRADGRVNDDDAAFFQLAYQSTQAPCADYDGDGLVDTQDLVVFTDAYMFGYTNTTLCDPSDPVTLTDIGAGILGGDMGLAAWGDYDNDGDLDLVIAGWDYNDMVTRVYRNDEGVFGDIGAGLPGVESCSVAWGDYDNDGDLDLALAGGTWGPPISRVYRNNAGVFTDIGAGLPGVAYCSVAWGDYDNDGDLDLVLAGNDGATGISRVFRNVAGVFTDIGAGLPGVVYCSVAWGDYDSDGDLDLALAGVGGGSRISRVYRNNAGVFTDIGAGLPGVQDCSAAWGDYDNDGDLDLVLTGFTPGLRISRVYRNNAGVFTDIGAGLPGVNYSSAAWGDYDNDGDLDLVLAGYDGATGSSRVYRNVAGVFTDIGAGLPGVREGSVAWGDYDNDGDLDLLLTGYREEEEELISRVYRSDNAPANSLPTAPTDLSTVRDGDNVTFHWAAATDVQTPTAGLSYNLRIGTTPGACDVMPAMADPANGFRRVAQLGNAQQRTSWTLRLPVSETYHWGVQAIDGAFAGSGFTSGILDVSGVGDAEAPSTYLLRANTPNPFRDATRISYDLRSAGPVDLAIYDTAGRRVRALRRNEMPAGRHEETWDGRDERGRALAAGVYHLRLTAGRFTQSQAVLLLR
jgi:hypothetical protein